MKIILTYLILIATLNIYAQEVTREGVVDSTKNKVSREYIKEIEKKTFEYEQLENKVPSYGPWVGSETRELLQAQYDKNNKALLYINENNLQGKWQEIENMHKYAGYPSYRNNPNKKVKRIKGFNQEIIKKLNAADAKTKEELSAELTEAAITTKHKVSMDDLDAELASLDAQLSTTDDDFLSENTTRPQKSIDDFLAEIDAERNTGDFLAENSNADPDDFLSGDENSQDENSYKIDYKDGKKGVIDSNGQVLIPYKNWSIIEYKGGIAYVKEIQESKDFCTRKVSIQKVGYVDRSGSFIDGFELDFIESSLGGTGKLYLIARDPDETYDELIARRNAEKRANELRIKKKKLREKKCEIEIKQWKQQMIIKYKQP